MTETGAVCEYEDFLKRIDSLGGEFAWISQKRSFLNTGDRTSQKRTPNEIIRDVLASQRVKAAIQAQAESKGEALSVVEDEAKEIVNTMAHRLQISSVRTVGYAVVKVVKMLFDGIYVNFPQLSALKKVFHGNPVVFMPSHRSYLDFLLVSLLCFDQDFPMPAIASAMDFMTSKLIGESLRRCGAFFIRRRVGNDCLYWSIFTEYIQTHIINADHPVEFFVEGTRSRSNKSLYPKFGLLQILLEPYFRRQIYDMVVVPVTINYDKILEECLFACELLGFSKPSESASGLFKARAVLNNRYGHVYMTFGKPISLRSDVMTLMPLPASRDPVEQTGLSDKEKQVARRFAHSIVQAHASMDVSGIWPYTCMVLLQVLEKRRMLNQCVEVSIREVLCDLEKIIEVAREFGKKVNIINGLSEDLFYYLELHPELFHRGTNFHSLDSTLKPARFSVGRSKVIEKCFVEEAVVFVLFWGYSNQIMHDYADIAVLCSVLSSQESLHVQDVLHRFCVLRQLFDHEFVTFLDEGILLKKFSETVKQLTERGVVEKDACEKLLVKNLEKIRLFSSFVEPYIYSYELLFETALGFSGTTVSSELLVEGSQRRIVELLRNSSNVRVPLRCLSADPLKNAIYSLASKKVFVKQHNDQYLVDGSRLTNMLKTLQLVKAVVGHNVRIPKSKL